VYLRGDNGTKVLNGLYIDHLYPAAGYTLAISGAGGSNVTIEDAAYIGMNSNPVLDGGSVNGQIRNFSTISGLKLLASTINVSNISTGTVSVEQVFTRNININPPSTVYISHPDLTINANITTDEAEDPQYNNLNLYASSNINIQSFTTSGGGGNINIQCGNNPSVFSVNITGDTYVSRTLNAGLGMSTNNINLSSINGAAYVPGGGGGGGSTISTFTSLTTSSLTVSSISGTVFTGAITSESAKIGTASAFPACAYFQHKALAADGSDYALLSEDNGSTFLNSRLGSLVRIRSGNSDIMSFDCNTAGLYKPLFMNDFPINLRNNSTVGLAYGSVAPYSVGIDGPFLFGFTQGALGTTSNANDISLAWDAAEVNIYKTLDMEDNFILNVSTITASGELSISANNDILTSAVSTINTVQNTYFTGGISKRLDGVGILQPVIQYGQVSSSGGSGTVIVSTPYAYSAVNSYLPFACMADAPAAELYVSTLTEQAFEIGWQNGGGGNQLFNWNTMGN
jgi:hypothetical protein